MPTSPEMEFDAESPRGALPWTTRGLALAALVLLSIVWVAFYPGGDLDDKAVHYYSAVRLYANPARAAAVDQATPTWLDRMAKASPRKEPFRTRNRLSSYWNYPIPSSVLRLLIELERPPGEPPHSYVKPLKTAFLLLHVFSLAWIVAVTWRSPWFMILAFACLAIASFCPPLPGLTYLTQRYTPFRPYAPGHSATLLLVGALTACQQRRWVMAGVSLVLMAGWHTGFGAMMVPLVLAGTGLTFAGGTSSRRARVSIALLLVVLAAAAFWLTPSHQSLLLLTVPLLILDTLLIAGRPWSHPAITVASVTSGFLFVAQLATAVLRNPGVMRWFTTSTGNQLLREVPRRLDSGERMAAIMLLLAALFGLVDWALGRWMRRVQRQWVLLGIMAALMIAVFAEFRTPIRNAAQGQCDFFKQEDDRADRQQVTTDALDQLKTRNEWRFFASLGDFLLGPPEAE